MPRTNLLTLPLSLSALVAAAPAFGLTADELWTQWQAQATASGQIMTADQVTTGDGTLTLEGFTTTFSDGEVSTVGRIDRMVMTEAPDGSVSVEMSDSYDFTITFVPEIGSPPVNVGIVVGMPGLEMTATGTPEVLSYDYSVPVITIEDGPITGGSGPPPTVDMSIVIQDFAAQYEIDGSDLDNIGYDTTSSYASMAGAVHILPPPGEVGQMKLVLATGAMTATGGGQLGNMAELAANPEVVPAGVDLTGAFEYDSLNLEFTFDHPQDAFTLITSNAGGSLSTSFSEAELAYGVTARDSATYIAGAELPTPVEFGVASSEIALRMPLAAAAEAQPFAARLAYRDLTLGDGIWAMADPAGSFPRDPITMIADVTGSLRIMEGLLSQGMEDMDGPPPVEVEQVTLNELEVSAAGATLTGTGSATFMPGNMPIPTGEVDLQLSGGMALLDTLEEAGIVPLEQLAVVRGMLGAFTRPGATPDTLETTIEIDETGTITANGVRLQ